VTVRAMRASDEAFVYSSWLRSYEDSDWAKSRWAAPYRKTQSALIEQLVESNLVYVVEAVDGTPGGLDLDGWICGWPEALVHYVFVRQSARGRGVARELLGALQIDKTTPAVYTHHARLLDLRRVPGAWRFDKGSLMLRKGKTMGKLIDVREVHFEADNAIPCAVRGQRDTRDYFPAQLGARIQYDPETKEFLVHDEIAYGVPAKDHRGLTLPPWRVPRERVKRWSAYEPGEAPWAASHPVAQTSLPAAEPKRDHHPKAAAP
jgi:GNAT superfamily N-acetyltransferase